jgi:glucose-6-phosphate 1-epimerase
MAQGGSATSATVPGVNGMPKVLLVHSSGSTAELYLNGAQVTSWKPGGQEERLFLSKAAVFQPGKAIRGGIPVIFPQFAERGRLPRHGWLRTTQWTVDPASETSFATFRTRDDDASRAMWPHSYDAALHVALEELTLEVTLSIINTGEDPFQFASALHTYLGVRDAAQVSLLGLYGSPYISTSSGDEVIVDNEQALRISEEIDRIYTGAPWRLELVDGASRLDIATSGFPDAVIWNPGVRAASEITDLAQDEYMRFVCVESALAYKPLELLPGDTWSGSQRLTCMP